MPVPSWTGFEWDFDKALRLPAARCPPRPPPTRACCQNRRMAADVASVWRGPMVMAAVEKLVRGTEWGRLNVLLGFGYVELSLSQQVRLSGAWQMGWDGVNPAPWEEGRGAGGGWSHFAGGGRIAHRPSTPSLAHTRTRPFTSLQGPGTGDCLLAIPSTLCLRLSLTDLPGRRCIQKVGGGGGEHDLLYLPSLLPYAMDFPPAADLRIEFLAQVGSCRGWIARRPAPLPPLLHPAFLSASLLAPILQPPHFGPLLIVLERICTGPLPTGQGTTFPIPFLPYYLSLHFPLQTLLTCAPPSSRLPLALPHITPGGGVLRVLHDRAGHYKRTSRFIVLEVRHSGGGEA
ncbi:unnamed protein product [Closterium sp. NIES-65]|nr:unnamed protein product [Closterium sp. NIES-65]